MKNLKYIKIIFLIGVFLLCFFIGSNIYATERRKVKVGFFPMDGYHIMNEDGNFGGMDVEYLDMLCHFTAWDIEYVVCDSWEDALQKLENKEIDLVGSAQYSAEREEIYDYADLSSGYTFGVIATNPGKNIAYEDFHAMENLTFGMVENYVRKNEFLDYLFHNGIENPKIIEYVSTAEMHDALDAEEIDAFVHTFTEVKEGQRLIGRFAPRPFYYITYDGNEEVINELNQAIVDLKMNRPKLETELMNQFYYDKFDKAVLLTTEEKNYLTQKETLVVGYLDNFYPFSYEEDGQFKGLTRELLESSLSITGLNLEYKLLSSRQEARIALQNGEIDIFAYSTDREVILKEYGLKSICDYTQVPLVLVMEKNKEIDKIQSLATVTFLEEQASSVILSDNVEVSTYDYQQLCIDILAEGDVDAVLCDGYLAEHLLRTEFKYGNLEIKSVLSGAYSISIAVSSNENILSSVLQKTIAEIDSKMINEYMLKENSYPLMNITDFIRNNSLIIIPIMFVVMGIIIFVIVHMLSDSRKIQQLMYKDTKLDIWNMNYFTYWGKRKILADRKQKYVIAYLNLSKFRSYNIIYGWNTGERLLQIVVDEIRSFVDTKMEICARNQGDHFVLLLTYQDERVVYARLQKLITSIERRIQNETSDHMHLQIGVYFILNHEVDLRVAVDYAKQALEFIDFKEGDSIKIYDDSLKILLKERHDREKLLEDVNINKDFVAFYQPKVDIRDGRIVGAEALVRFKDPTENGIIRAPYYFVPYYEQTGKITEVDFFVFETACKLLRRRIDNGQSVVPISCNFSRMHFMKSGFVEHFENILHKYKISKELIEVEVTESLIMGEVNQDILKETFEQLKEKDIHLSIDDFGTGYSSLGVFEQIPASVVKMDRSFFLNHEYPERQVKIMRGIVTLSEELDTQVICEGVETKKDVRLMEEIGAYVAQGYFYSKPVSEQAFEEMLNNGYMKK